MACIKLKNKNINKTYQLASYLVSLAYQGNVNNNFEDAFLIPESTLRTVSIRAIDKCRIPTYHAETGLQ